LRLSEFWNRMGEAFGPAYAKSVAADQVVPGLGRTVNDALRHGEDVLVIWRAIASAYPDRVPARLR
jgi:hypothetical protein